VQRLKIIFRKGEGARFLSHLDLMATLEYAARRARLPVELSEGFNPRPRMSAAAPLALGHIGESEILELALRQSLPPQEVGKRLGAALPPGISILSAEELPEGQKPSASRLRSATYRVELPHPVPNLAARVADLLSRESLQVEELRKDRVRERDLRPLILSLEPLDGEFGLRMRVTLDAQGTVRPEQILILLGVSPEGARIVREAIEVAG
jgi:radical SAM-linked protein